MHDVYDPLDFISAHHHQIKQKASAWHIDWEDYAQEIALLIIERKDAFDPRRGSFQAFVFGHVEKKLGRCRSDALFCARSIDEESDRGENARRAAEAISSKDENILTDSSSMAIGDQVPGAADLLSISESITGMSAMEIAGKLNLSKRRINQILKKKRDDAKTQFALNFGGQGAEA